MLQLDSGHQFSLADSAVAMSMMLRGTSKVYSTKEGWVEYDHSAT